MAANDKFILTDENLKIAYIDKKKTMSEIAEEIGCNPATILYRLRRAGIKTRKRNEYPPTENVKKAWVRIGKARKGKVLSESTRQAISKAHKGMRLRNDYEFGGHEKIRTDGYVSVYCPDHPTASKDGYVLKHRIVIETHLGHAVPNGYIVHHKNGKKDDNRLENLELMKRGEHTAFHTKQRNGEKKL